jgi:hypothetical protein
MDPINPTSAIRPEMVLNAQLEVIVSNQPSGIIPNQDSSLTGKPIRNLTPNWSHLKGFLRFLLASSRRFS